MGLDNSRSIFYLALRKTLFCVIIYLREFFNSPTGPPAWGTGPPTPPCGAVLALLPICYICTPTIELNSFSIDNDHSYQLDDFDNDYQLIAVFQRVFLITYLSKATGAILRHPTC